MKRLRFLILFAFCVSCKPAPQQPAKPAAVPQVRATVISIRTTIQPGKKMYDYAIVIARNRARSTGEHDTWRLFDTKANTVTFVDDVGKTIRTEPLDAIMERRAKPAPLPPHYPRATLARTNGRRLVITSGAYRRELSLDEHPSVPRGLFAMMHASDTPSSPLAPMMHDVDQALAAERGFPLSDRTEVPLGKERLIVERTVTSIAEREVPEALLELPKDYKDITPKTKTQ